MKYVIIGSGAAACAAAQEIAKNDYGSSITLIAPNPKTIFKPSLMQLCEGIDKKHLKRLPDDFYVQNNITLIKSKVTQITGKHVEAGKTISYDKLLIATGATHTPLDIAGSDRHQVFDSNTTKDMQQLATLLPTMSKVAVIGGGTRGLHIATSLAKKGVQVYVIEKDQLLNTLPAQLHAMLLTDLRLAGVHTILNDQVAHIGGQDKDVSYLETNKRTRLEVQGVVLAHTTQPQLDWLPKSIKKRKGIMVNDFMATNAKNIWAAGGVAEINDAQHNQTWQCNSWHDAYKMGQVAGKNMTGNATGFKPSLITRQVDLGYNTLYCIGNLTPDRRERIIHNANRLKKEYVHMVVNQDSISGVVCYGKYDPFTIQQIIHKQIPLDLNDTQLTQLNFSSYVFQ